MNLNLSDLLNEIAAIYPISDIAEYCSANQINWNYSLMTNNCQKHGSLIVGFNWGASQDQKYAPQSSIPETGYIHLDIGSMSRTLSFFERFYGSGFLENISQTNFCFFRSKSEDQISPKDIELCKPIFEKLLSIIEPKLIISFSSKLRNYLLENQRLTDVKVRTVVFKRGGLEITYDAIKAKLDGSIEIHFLPHPNFPMKREARELAWKFVSTE